MTPPLALLWDATRRGYVAIKCLGGEWFVVQDLGMDYRQALIGLEGLNNARNPIVS